MAGYIPGASFGEELESDEDGVQRTWSYTRDEETGAPSVEVSGDLTGAKEQYEAVRESISSNSSSTSNDEPTNTASEETNESNNEQAAREEAFNSFREEMQQQQAAFLEFVSGMTQEQPDESDESASAGTGGFGFVALAIGAVALVYALVQGGN